MSPMAKERVWKLEVVAGVERGRGPFALKGFEQVDAETMKAVRVLEGLEHEDLRSIVSEIHEYMHGDEHG
jgi:hypothetical protein